MLIIGLAKEVNEEDFPNWNETKFLKFTMGSQTRRGHEKRSREVERVLYEFRDVMSSKPSRMTAMEHIVATISAQPIRQAPYRIPHAYRDTVAKELVEMEQSGIIEPSFSKWASPIIITKKK